MEDIIKQAEKAPSTTPQEPRLSESRARLTVINHVYHQSPGTDATVTSEKTSIWLESEEQPYVRRYNLKAELGWQTLDYQWIEKPLLLKIRNEEQEGSIRVIEIGVDIGCGNAEVFSMIPPGLPVLLYPCGSLFLRSRTGEAVWITVTVVPK